MNSRLICTRSDVSHHALGVVSGVCCSSSVVASEPNSDNPEFQGISAFLTIIGGSQKTACELVSATMSRGELTKLDVFARLPYGPKLACKPMFHALGRKQVVPALSRCGHFA